MGSVRLLEHVHVTLGTAEPHARLRSVLDHALAMVSALDLMSVPVMTDGVVRSAASLHAMEDVLLDKESVWDLMFVPASLGTLGWTVESECVQAAGLMECVMGVLESVCVMLDGVD